MTSQRKRRQRIVLSLVALGLVLLGAAAGRVIMRARRTAAVSCLRAMSASLDRQSAFARAEAGTAWREWSREELLEELGTEERGDCPDGWWRDDVGLRTRDAGGGRVELHIWRRSGEAMLFWLT